MNELHLQDKFLIPFFRDGLGYKEVKANKSIKIISKIDEFLAHEQEPDYFEKMLEKQLAGVGEAKKKELLEKRKAYSNNKNVYSLLMQYAAGFGKSNIIGWSALQLKDLRCDGEYVYDKIMIVVDRLQLRV